MLTPRLFCPDPLEARAECVLAGPAAHHAVRVLRLREGDALALFDGGGGEYPATIVAIARDRVEVALAPRLALERESRLPLTLVQALQAADKMDHTVQKAVELGVGRIVPVESRRSVVRLDGVRAAKRVEHWRQIVVAACEQCGRNRLPSVEAIESLPRYLARPAGAVTRLFLSPLAECRLADLPPPVAVELLVGPEGGLAPDEAQAAEAVGYRPVRLGPRILRTETAGMAALAAIHARWGDFNE